VGPRERYRRVLRAPNVLGLWGASTLARLPIGINGLAIVLAMRAQTGSYAAAGLAAGAYAATLALTNPLYGRLLDRHGPRRVLPPLVGVHVVVMLAFVGLLGDAPVWVLVALAGLSGAGLPPWSSILRAMWPRLLGAEDLVTTAFALDAAIVETVFVVGPLLVALALAVAGPEAALLGATALVSAGTALLVASPAIRGWETERGGSGHLLGALRSPGLLTVFLATIPVGFSFGAIEIALPAFAEAEGHPGRAGLLIAVWGAGSMAGALVYGALPGRRALGDRWLLFTALMAVGSLFPLAAGSSAAMALLLVPCGAFIAPAIASGSQLMGLLSPPGMTTEAYAWGPTALVMGAAAGNALSGALVEATNWRSAILAAALAAAAGALLGRARRRTLELPVAIA